MIRLRKIGSLVLASLLLVGSVGITMNTHYCMGEVMDVALYQQTEPCFMGTSSEEEMPTGCCTETSEEFRVDDLSQQALDFSISGLVLISEVHQPLMNAQRYTDNGTITNVQYKPPLIDSDIPILVQSFLL